MEDDARKRKRLRKVMDGIFEVKVLLLFVTIAARKEPCRTILVNCWLKSSEQAT